MQKILEERVTNQIQVYQEGHLTRQHVIWRRLRLDLRLLETIGILPLPFPGLEK